MYLIGNRPILCSSSDCSGFAVYYNVRQSKLRVVWMISGNRDQSETIHMNRLSSNKWVHCVITITKNASPTDGVYPSTISFYIQGVNKLIRRTHYHPLGLSPLFVGADPNGK